MDNYPCTQSGPLREIFSHLYVKNNVNPLIFLKKIIFKIRT